MNLAYGDSLSTVVQLILFLNLKKKKKNLSQDISCYTSIWFWLHYTTEVALAFLQV